MSWTTKSILFIIFWICYWLFAVMFGLGSGSFSLFRDLLRWGG